MMPKAFAGRRVMERLGKRVMPVPVLLLKADQGLDGVGPAPVSRTPVNRGSRTDRLCRGLAPVPETSLPFCIGEGHDAVSRALRNDRCMGLRLRACRYRVARASREAALRSFASSAGTGMVPGDPDNHGAVSRALRNGFCMEIMARDHHHARAQVQHRNAGPDPSRHP